MLATQSAGRTRGTGRYTRALVSELVREAGHEWFVYSHGGLPVENLTHGDVSFYREPTASAGATPGGCDTSLPVGADGGRLNESACNLPNRDVKVTERVLPAQTSLHLNAEQLQRANADGLDLFLLSSALENFQGYLPPFPNRRGPRLATLLYDLIPLRFPQHYLGHPGIAEAYRRALAAVRQYDVLLTISESCRQDVIELLQLPADRVVTIGAGSDAMFFHPPESPTPGAAAARWLTEHGIVQPFVYALTALDFRKNLAGLLAAIERLPTEPLSKHQFVITCAGSDQDVQKARGLMERSPVASRLLLTPKLTDDGLRTLYQFAAAFILPSRYEGFGLPLVEAMQCGAPVIGGNNSSQVEVVGDAGLLADVENADALALHITRLLHDQRLAQQLRSKGIERARRFNWQAVASRCLRALEETACLPRRSHWLGTWAARGRLAIEARLNRLAPRQRRVPA